VSSRRHQGEVGLFGRFRQACRRERVSALHIMALEPLAKQELPIGELASWAGVTTAAATGLVDAMEAAGLAGRARRTVDRRVVWVEITEHGREVFDRVRRAVDGLPSAEDSDGADVLEPEEEGVVYA